jgi:hypothetical protein
VSGIEQLNTHIERERESERERERENLTRLVCASLLVGPESCLSRQFLTFSTIFFFIIFHVAIFLQFSVFYTTFRVPRVEHSFGAPQGFITQATRVKKTQVFTM